MLHLYWGDGKGKTTAAMGLALRALGHGRRVVILQFLKDGSSGEIEMLRRCGAVVYACPNIQRPRRSLVMRAAGLSRPKENRGWRF